MNVMIQNQEYLFKEAQLGAVNIRYNGSNNRVTNGRRYLQCLKSTRNWYLRLTERNFPGGSVVKNPPANARDTGSNPGPGRSHMLRSN